MKKLICLALGCSAACCILPRAAEPTRQPSAPETLAWLKRVDGELKKSSLADLTLDQLATRTEITLGGHRKTDGKHLNIPAAEFHHLAALPALRRLVLWENDGVTDEALVHVGRLTNLRELELGDAPITSDGIKQLRGLKSLRFLGLGWTKEVGDAALPVIAALPGLEILVLSGTKVTDAGLKQVGTMKKLIEIRLAAMPQVTDAGLMQLQTCPALRTVVLNKKTGVTPEGLAEFRRRRPDCQVVLK